MAFSQPAQKKAYQGGGGGHGHPRTPLAMPLKYNTDYKKKISLIIKIKVINWLRTNWVLLTVCLNRVCPVFIIGEGME